MNPQIEQSIAPCEEADNSSDLRLLKHDVKNHVTSILCFCSLLRQSSVDLKPKQVEYLNQIQASTKAILVLLNALGADKH